MNDRGSLTLPLQMEADWSARLRVSWPARFAESPGVLKNSQHTQTVVSVRDFEIGGDEFITMAGPCSVETEAQLLSTAEHVSACGARVLRGGAFKPRSSPYAFQGHGLEGLKLLDRARAATGLAIVTEVMSEGDVPLVAEYADILQIGSRSMENYTLLETAARSGRPILLKRGMVATVADLLPTDAPSDDLEVLRRQAKKLFASILPTEDRQTLSFLNQFLARLAETGR